MRFMIIFAGFMATLTSTSPNALADHSPKKMMRNMNAFSQLGETGKLGPFKINVAVFGRKPSDKLTYKANARINSFLQDDLNLASIVLKNGSTISERYNAGQNINSNTPLLGMSMSKTAAGAVIGFLLCEGKIRSLDDKAGLYSKFLKSTPYAKVSIRNILQMNSGVSPLGRSDEKKFTQKSRGVRKFKNQANVREALNFYKSAAREQGTRMNYHSSDTLALSVLAEDITGTPLSKLFYEKVYVKFGESNYMHWTGDNTGTTVAFSGLVMTARDWAEFGQYLMAQKKAKTCLGEFFNEGVKNSVSTGKTNGSRYGYQFWVFDVAGTPSLVLQGHGGQFVVLNERANTVLLTISINEKYKVGNLFSKIHKIAAKIN